MKNKLLDTLSKEELIELIELYCKNWLAMDGLWFQSIEKKFGMDEAMAHDVAVWEKYSKHEIDHIKKLLNLPDNAGLDGLEKALGARPYANINSREITREENTLTYRMLDCRIQNARSRKGMEWHPCKQVGLIANEVFCYEVDPKIRCTALSCYPDLTDDTCCCSWKFVYEDDSDKNSDR